MKNIGFVYSPPAGYADFTASVRVVQIARLVKAVKHIRILELSALSGN